MFENVLLPVDLNHPESWEKALPAAERLMDEDGTLHILGIAPDFGSSMVASYFPPDYETRVLRELHEHLTAFVAERVDDRMNAQVHVGHGHIAETILKLATDIGASAIVMASHPPDDLKNLLIGSNADKVVRHARIPVLVLR